MTSRSMAFNCRVPLLFYRIGLGDLIEVPSLLERFDDAEIEIVVGVTAANIGTEPHKLVQDVLCAGNCWCRVARHRATEVIVGRVDDLLVLGAEALRDYFFRLL